MKLKKYLLAGGFATALMLGTSVYAQDDVDDDTDVEEEDTEEVETEEDPEDDEVEEDVEDDLDDDEDIEGDIEDDEALEDDVDLDDEESDEEVSSGDSMLGEYRDDLITFLQMQNSIELETVATVEGLDWQHQTNNVTLNVYGYEIYRVVDDSELSEYDPRMFVLFDAEVVNEEEVAVDFNPPLQLRFNGAYDTARVASEYNMPDSLKHESILGTEDGTFDLGSSRVPMVVHVDAEQAAYHDESTADLIFTGVYRFAEPVPGEDGRRNGQASHPFKLVDSVEELEEPEFYWDLITANRFADKEMVFEETYDDLVLENGYLDVQVNGMQVATLTDIDLERDRNQLEDANQAAITVEIELTNHTSDPIRSTNYRTELKIDGQDNRERVNHIESFDIYPGESVTVHDIYLAPANQVESYESIVLALPTLRDAHNNDLVERDEVSFELLD